MDSHEVMRNMGALGIVNEPGDIQLRNTLDLWVGTEFSGTSEI